MPISTRFAIDYPLGSEAPDIDGDILKIVNALEALGAQYGQGTLAAQPVSTPGSPGKIGRFYIVTSGSPLGGLYYDHGTGWLHLNPDQTPAAGSVTVAMLAATLTGIGAKIPAGEITSSHIVDATIVAGDLANALKPSTGAGAGTEALRALGMGTALAMSQAEVDNFNMVGTLASRPAATAVVAGTQYFATDQVVDYVSDAAVWHRKGIPAGATLDWFNATVPNGWVEYNGANLPGSTGIYADLFLHLGSTLLRPDTRGRVTVGKGSHVDVDTVGENDGVGITNRRGTKHRHTPHSHDVLTIQSNYRNDAAGVNMVAFNSTPLTDEGVETGLRDGGSGVATDPLDGAAFIVCVKIAKL